MTHTRFAFIKARWHADIVDQSLIGFEARLAELGIDAQVDSFDVPGAFELPLLVQKLAETCDYDAVLGAAFVIDGGIYRHEFVAQTVVQGLMDVGLKTGVPVLSVSLTPHKFDEKIADDHTYFFDHFVKKGAEAADAATSIVTTYAGLKSASVQAVA